MPAVGRLTQLEKHYLKEQLSMEQLCLAKCNNYLNQIQDPALKSVIQQTRDVCQSHVNTLSSTLQQAGYNPQQMMS
ncbi:MAG: hypothetical protein HPY71_03475 [Firmicutes bacterium]|nr:hypothetical protein [Bacillota bacterium]